MCRCRESYLKPLWLVASLLIWRAVLSAAAYPYLSCEASGLAITCVFGALLFAGLAEGFAFAMTGGEAGGLGVPAGGRRPGPGVDIGPEAVIPTAVPYRWPMGLLVLEFLN
jgi:hypothetical protein